MEAAPASGRQKKKPDRNILGARESEGSGSTLPPTGRRRRETPPNRGGRVNAVITRGLAAGASRGDIPDTRGVCFFLNRAVRRSGGGGGGLPEAGTRPLAPPADLEVWGKLGVLFGRALLSERLLDALNYSQAPGVGVFGVKHGTGDNTELCPPSLKRL